MSLRDITIKREYRSLIDNVVQEFYIPLLNEANVYKRAVGFFSSSALIEISKGIASLAKNGGRIQIVASPFLSEEDVKAIKDGYAARENVIERALIRQLVPCADYFSMKRLNLLANLIADGIMDIKIAVTEDQNGFGMYHEKMGIIEDMEGNKVAFSGSMNESRTAMSLNYETIDVFCNWGNSSDEERVLDKENAFTSIWNDFEPNIKVMEFKNLNQEIIKMYKKSAPNFEIDAEQFQEKFPEYGKADINNPEKNAIGPRIPVDIELFDYQKEAIANWVGENYRGIFDMATGTGKTLTGLGAVSQLSESLNDNLAVIILCPYQHLVEQWVEDIVRFNISPIIGYSSSSQKDWKERLSKAIRDQRIRDDKRFFCFISTNATFKSKFVQEQISKIKSKKLLLVDEAHNVGALSISKLLDNRFEYRLALSATLDRHHDEEGTAFLYSFFGRKCIEYDLERAIAENKLTPYKYYPIIVTLSEEELREYEILSQEIARCVINKDGKKKLSKKGEILALQRSRLIAGAAEKLSALKIAIKPYIKEKNLLVYCGATILTTDEMDTEEDSPQDLRQIDAVTQLLGNELGMSVAKFTAAENIEERATIKEQFLLGRLQAIVAIKCLDEGVNIPGIKTAFILASTTNPKEYIQRRGRVLRKAPNKPFAEIYDFVTLPREIDSVSGLTEEQAKRDLPLVRNELSRMIEFGCLAMNSMESNNIIWDIEEAYHITSLSEEGGVEWIQM